MQYPEILSIIDANIERLRQARLLLLSAPLHETAADPAITTSQPAATGSPQKRLTPSRRVRRTAEANPTTNSTAEVDLHEAYTEPIVSPTPELKPIIATLPPSAVTVIAAQRPFSPRHRKQIRPQPSALQSAAPSTPVAVSAEQAQRIREQKQAAQKARETAHEGRQEPVLSAEYLSQQWLRKGLNASQRS